MQLHFTATFKQVLAIV